MPLESEAQLSLVLFHSHSSMFTMKVKHIEWAEFWDRLRTLVVFPVHVCVDFHDLITLMPFILASLAPYLPSGTYTHFPLYSTIKSCCVQNKLILIISKTPVLDLKMMSCISTTCHSHPAFCCEFPVLRWFPNVLQWPSIPGVFVH